jgi:hypothetical protein
MFIVSPFARDTIYVPLTLEELWLILKPVLVTIAGLDGISDLYLKWLWDISNPLFPPACQHSLDTYELPPSLKKSLLCLISKENKDTTSLQNWRQITFSNCDHKAHHQALL